MAQMSLFLVFYVFLSQGPAKISSRHIIAGDVSMSSPKVKANRAAVSSVDPIPEAMPTATGIIQL